MTERTSLSNINLEHFKIFGEAGRSNKVIFEKLLEQNQYRLEKEQPPNGVFEWLSIRFISLGYYALVDINKVSPVKIEIDESLAWYNIHNVPKMMMDHNETIEKALESLKMNLSKNIIVMNLLPETIFGETYARNNFQKNIGFECVGKIRKEIYGGCQQSPLFVSV